MAGMSGKYQRDYRSADFIRIHNPSIYHIRRAKNEGVLVCECYRWISDTHETDHKPIFKYRHDTDLADRHRIKLVYCYDCLEHFGCVACPIIRGVPAYKTIDPLLLDKIRSM